MSKKKPVDTAERVSAEALLKARPMANENMEIAATEDGGAQVSVPMRRPRWLAPPISWIVPFSSHRRVELDRLGMEVLNACDGRRSIEEIIETFASGHKLTFREAQLSVMQFLRQLTERGLVVIVGLQEDAENDETD